MSTLLANWNGTVGVLCGGLSAEREISLKTGTAVHEALVAGGIRSRLIDVTRDSIPRLAEMAFDVAFIALHGRLGEDGTVQGMLELLGIPYTGSSVLGSALAMNKLISKKIFLQDGIPTPDFLALERNRVGPEKRLLQAVLDGPGLPAVVKPANEGSTVGISVVRERSDILAACEDAFQHDRWILVERYITGMEATVGIIEEQALPIVEIVPAGGFYDWRAKYFSAGTTEYVIPARLPAEVTIRARQLALRAHHALHCRHVSRVDFRITSEGALFVLEVNTIPGMTSSSLLPMAARHVGFSFADLVERLVFLALPK